MHRAGEPSAESEANEHLDSILVLPDALDSVQMDDRALQDAIEMGVLYSCVVPGSGNVIGGHSAVIRNYAKDSTAANQSSHDTDGGSRNFAKQVG